MRNSGCLPREKPAATESCYPTYGACWVFHCIYNPPNSDLDCGIFNVCTDVNACDCTRGCMDTVREFALKVDSGRKIPCRTGESNLRGQRAGPMLYQLSYIPTLPVQLKKKLGGHTHKHTPGRGHRSTVLSKEEDTSVVVS